MDKQAQLEGMAKVLDDFVDGSWDIAQALYAAGYRKLPTRPKVLSDEELKQVWRNNYDPISGFMHARKGIEVGAQAQRDYDWEQMKRHYEVKDA